MARHIRQYDETLAELEIATAAKSVTCKRRRRFTQTMEGEKSLVPSEVLG